MKWKIFSWYLLFNILFWLFKNKLNLESQNIEISEQKKYLNYALFYLSPSIENEELCNSNLLVTKHQNSEADNLSIFSAKIKTSLATVLNLNIFILWSKHNLIQILFTFLYLTKYSYFIASFL